MLKVHNLDTGKEYTFSKYPVNGIRALNDGRAFVILSSDGDYSFYTVLDSNGNMEFEPLLGYVSTLGLNISVGSTDYLVPNAVKLYDVFNNNDKMALASSNTSGGLGEVALIDLTTGKIDPNFDSAQKYKDISQFYDGLTRVKDVNNKYHYIDRSGKEVIS